MSTWEGLSGYRQLVLHTTTVTTASSTSTNSSSSSRALCAEQLTPRTGARVGQLHGNTPHSCVPMQVCAFGACDAPCAPQPTLRVRAAPSSTRPTRPPTCVLQRRGAARGRGVRGVQRGAAEEPGAGDGPAAGGGVRGQGAAGPGGAWGWRGALVGVEVRAAPAVWAGRAAGWWPLCAQLGPCAADDPRRERRSPSCAPPGCAGPHRRLCVCSRCARRCLLSAVCKPGVLR